ncbi:family 43 glycosylhydrolase (plasmid) [Pedobacter sp. BS3]|nr:family 43 glycosylhydrolase [Pedobacter sp. BS3]
MNNHWLQRAFMLYLLIIAQSGYAQQYSDPYAPVGDKRYTVPDIVRPLFDYWMRDTYITYGPDSMYYMTGTTAPPDRKFQNNIIHPWDYNDGIYLWQSADMKVWKPLGRIWSFDKDATWQKKGVPLKPKARGVNGEPLDSMYRAAWAPELHYIKSKKQWLLVACLSGKVGSFVLKSVSGKPTGPYVNIPGNSNGPIFSAKEVIAIPGNTEKLPYSGIDGTLFEDDNGEVYFIGKDHYIAKMKDDLSGLAEPFRRFKETPYNPEQYIEGVYMVKHHGKYQLLQTVWCVRDEPGKNKFSYIENGNKALVHSYDVVVAEADNIYGPYGPRYPAILEGGHNNLFTDKDGNWWSTTFFNPRGEMGKIYPVTCRPAVLAVKWENNKLMPDIKRTEQFYKSLK